MEFEDLIRQRQTCRNYDPERPVEREMLVKCLEAACLAPSACNSQPWSFIAVTEPALVAKLKECIQSHGSNGFSSQCSTFVAVVEERARLHAHVEAEVGSQYFAPIDIGISIAHFLLEATNLGLGACVFGWVDDARTKEALGLDPGKRVRAILSLGYPKDNHLRSKVRKPFSEVVSFRE